MAATVGKRRAWVIASVGGAVAVLAGTAGALATGALATGPLATTRPAGAVASTAGPAVAPASSLPTPTSGFTAAPPPAEPTQAPAAAPAHRPVVPPPPPRPAQAARCPSPGTSAAQVVVVHGSGSSATVWACQRAADGSYTVALGPFAGHVGKNGVAPQGAKREGDLRTPSGVYPLRAGFGVQPNPGLSLGWRVVDSADVWVDDPNSALYNTPQRNPAGGRWASAESLYQVPAYSYALVIGYNEARTPRLGSAIFFHVDLGHGTAGCVSVPQSALLQVFRWVSPGAVMAIS